MAVYVVFDGDKDIWAYRYMRGWRASQNVNFDFEDAHEHRPLQDTAGEQTVKRRLRERMRMCDTMVVLVGESTRNLYKFVRWELDLAVELDLAMIVANLNGHRQLDLERCPPLIREHDAVHVAYKARIIDYALTQFPQEFRRGGIRGTGPRHYARDVYRSLGIRDDE